MKMRKFLAVLLVLAMVLTGSVVALADDVAPAATNLDDGYNANDLAWVRSYCDRDSFSDYAYPVNWSFVTWSDSDTDKRIIELRVWDWLFQTDKLDFSGLAELKELTCTFDELTELNISQNTKLEVLNCSYNNLSTLDISKNTNLEVLNCSWNELTTLDISKNTSLKELNCRDNNITKLNVSKNTALEVLDCSYNEITSLNVSALTKLESLDCDNNKLSSLNVSGMTKLESLTCGNEGFTSLNVSGCKAITSLTCGVNGKGDVIEHSMTSLDISDLTELTYLSCANGQLKSLDLSHQSKLTQLFCEDNDLTSLDLTTCTKLERFDCTYNYLPSKDEVKGVSSWGSGFFFSPQKESATDPSDDDDKTDDDSIGDDDTSDDNTDSGNTTKPNTGTTSGSSSKSTEKSPRENSNIAAEKSALETIKSVNAGKASSKVQNYPTAAGTSVPAVSVKLYGWDASLSLDMMNTLAEGSTGLRVSLDNGAAYVLIPAGFTMTKAPGVLGYALAYQKDPMNSYLMKALVKDENAQTETHCLGGGELPTAATVTLKTKLKGAVNVYHWDETARKATLVTTGAAEGGKVNFATKQLGSFIVTDGTI